MKRPEDSRVKIPALIHLTRLGYKYLSLRGLTSGINYDSNSNIFYAPFKEALNNINNTELDDHDIKSIIEELNIKLSNDDLGKSFFDILQSDFYGYKLIDFKNPNNNIYNVVTELPYESGEDSFRPDIIILINGMPLSFIEVKRQNNREGILAERERMTRRFSNSIFKKFVNITQFTVFSNNNEYDDDDIEPIQGAFYASPAYGSMFFSKFREQRNEELVKELEDINEETSIEILKDNNLIAIKGTPEFETSLDSNTPTNSILSSLYSRSRIMFILKYGICYREFTDDQGIRHIEKHIMRYPQIFATLAIRDKLDEGIRKGVIWHTQGSGKTALAYSNVKFLKDYFQKQKIIAKFYFIVDRISLAEQAKDEFEDRGLPVVLVNSKEDFKQNINLIGEDDNKGTTTMNVVNIQKFSEESVTKPSDYNVSVQRIYFLDEAHRSYNPKGSFLANLIASDRDAIMIALTGTPLIGDGYNTKDVFGNYIHKYYYNQSIADGYTLKLIREEIETTYRAQLANTLDQLEVQLGSIPKPELYAHPKFVGAMVGYIVEDFKKGRVAYGDSSIGAMIVCDSSKQAREVNNQLNKIDDFSHALVLHDEGTKEDRENIQKSFKKGSIDILVVYNMLLTGFDAPRLKKQYLARLIKSHNLLQTLTRVNRPYKHFRYGFVVDFANIKEEFDKTNEAYFKELQQELGDEVENYSNLFKSAEEIEKELLNIKNQLFLYDTNNMVNFINQINSTDDKKTLLDLRTALDNYKVLQNLIKMFGYEELIGKFDITKALEMFTEVNNRIAILNLQHNIAYAEETTILLNTALDQIDFHFKKIKDEELVIADAFRAELEKTRFEVSRGYNLDPKDPEYGSLLDELKRLFKKKNIEELTTDEMNDYIKELEKLRRLAEDKTHQDLLLAEKYNGDIKFMRAHKRLTTTSAPIGDALTIHSILMAIKKETDETIENNENILGNETYFMTLLQPVIINACKHNNASVKPDQIKYIDILIAQEYFEERKWAA